jgi:hypothetical protein
VISLISTHERLLTRGGEKQARQRTCRLPYSTSNIEMSIINLDG